MGGGMTTGRRALLALLLLPIALVAGATLYVTAQLAFRPSETLLSFELEIVDPAPPASTRQQRVWLWLHQRRDLIVAAARKYRVPAVAIAGVVAWEALDDPAEHSLPRYLYVQGLKLEGPGKVHAQDLDRSHNAAAFLEDNPRYQPILSAPAGPWYEPVILRRVLRLMSSAGSIEYIAGIMNAYVSEAEWAGYVGNGAHYLKDGIRNRPEILASYINGVRGFDLPHAHKAFQRRMRERGFAPFVHSSYAGRFIVMHPVFLRSALELPIGWPHNPVFRRVAEQRRFRYVQADPCSLI
jgi:hypothetical protein